jgi:hypothetical protein
MAGRNDPCPCGSGKKYKNCCWVKDRAAQTAVPIPPPETPPPPPAADEPPQALQPAPALAGPAGLEQPPPLPVEAGPEPEPDPLLARINAFWETFQEASYAERWALLDEMLANEPELCDAEMIFETANDLYAAAIERGERERFGALLDRFAERAPEAYAQELGYIAEWRAQLALMAGDRAGVEEAFLSLTPLAGARPDRYFRVLSMLAYHGELEILLAGMWAALPDLAAAQDLLPSTYRRFVDKLAVYELLRLVDADPQVTAVTPELAARLADQELTLATDDLNRKLAYLSGRARPAWTPDDFRKLGANAKANPAVAALYSLLDAFVFYAHATAGVPWTKAEMAAGELASYLINRARGRLSEEEQRPPARLQKKKAARALPLSPLCPDAKTLDKYLGQLLRLFSFQPYEACALFELLPLWLDFLAESALLDGAAGRETVDSLAYIKSSLLRMVEGALADPLAAHNLASWPGRLT